MCKGLVGFDMRDLSQARPGATKVERVLLKAAIWANFSHRMPLKHYLSTEEGRCYGDLWSDAEVDQADQDVIKNIP